MKDLKEILVRKKIEVKPSKRKRNLDWEDAEVMATYLNLKTTFIMRMFKKFGKNKVLDCKGYLKDFNGDCTLEQALVFKLSHLDI